MRFKDMLLLILGDIKLLLFELSLGFIVKLNIFGNDNFLFKYYFYYFYIFYPLYNGKSTKRKNK